MAAAACTDHPPESAEQCPKAGTLAEPQLCPHGRLLVVEDARCVQMQLACLLKALNLEADMVNDGEAACKIAMQSQASGSPYSVILMDVQMPKMSGKQAVKWLREVGWKGPIIAVSMHSSEKERTSLLAAGYNCLLSKPVTKASLHDTLAAFLDGV
jgi:DNA-binding response OmpR family regulator